MKSFHHVWKQERQTVNETVAYVDSGAVTVTHEKIDANERRDVGLLTTKSELNKST